MYAAGAKGSMDGISLHPYPSDIDFWAFFKAMNEARTVRDAWGDSGSKLWATEFGVSTTDRQNRNWWFDDRDQAATLTRMYRYLRVVPDIGGAFIHSLIESSLWPETDKENGFGVLHEEPAFTPKPAYCALAIARGAEYECPEGTPPNPGPNDPAQVGRWDAQELNQAAVVAAGQYRRERGTYAGLDSAALHAIDPRISATPATGAEFPGPSAHPDQMGVYFFQQAGENILICNTSKADRSYCQWGRPDASWAQGYTQSVIFVTTTYTLGGLVSWW